MGSTDSAPFFVDGLPEGCLVADVIMQPLITPLLAQAEGRGLPICTGDGMLENQLRTFAQFLGFAHTDEAARIRDTQTIGHVA